MAKSKWQLPDLSVRYGCPSDVVDQLAMTLLISRYNKAMDLLETACQNTVVHTRWREQAEEFLEEHRADDSCSQRTSAQKELSRAMEGVTMDSSVHYSLRVLARHIDELASRIER